MASELELIRAWLEAESREELARAEMRAARDRHEEATKETQAVRMKLLELVPDEGQKRRLTVMAFGKKVLIEIEHNRGYSGSNQLRVYSYDIEEL